MIKLIFAICLLLPTLVFARNSEGNIDYLGARSSDGLIYLTLKDAVDSGNRPVCAKYNYWMIKDENSKTGERQFSMLLAAKLANKKINIYGANTCTRWADGEDINIIEIK